MVLQFLFQRFRGFVAFGERHHHLDDLPAIRIGHAGNGAFDDRRMADQRAFHLKRTDAIAGGFDRIVRTADEVIVSLLILPNHIAGVIHTLAEDPFRRLRVTIIAHTQAGRTSSAHIHAQFSLFAHFYVAALPIHHMDLIMREKEPRSIPGAAPSTCA